jgi:hypothetical protein
VTHERSGGPEPDEAGGASDGEPGTGDEREARLHALLSVRVAVPDDDLGPGPLGGHATARRIGVGTVLAVVVLLGLFTTGAGLVYAGTRIIRSSTEGEVLEEQTDPSAPGYEALVAPTPTMLVVHDVEGTVEALTVLTLPDPGAGGGGVVHVPTRTVSDMPIFGYAPIEAAYDLGTAQVQAEVVGDVLTTGIGEVVVVDAERWAGLVAPVAPVTIENPDDLEVDGELVFPAGQLELEAEDVGPYLEADVDDESDLARLFRHELLWKAWLAAVAEAGDPEAVPGELEVGLGRFVRELAAGPAVVETLPVEATVVEGFEDAPTFVPDTDAIAALVAEIVPFPRSPRPGVRERVRILNGTEDLDEARALASALPPVGVEVVVVGNASALDHDTTTIAYVDASHEAAAEEIRELLGVGEVFVDPRPSDVVDITVTLGVDHD